MKTALLALLALGLGAPAVSAATPDELMAAPRAFIAALDRNDIVAAGKTLTASPSFIDEFPPMPGVVRTLSSSGGPTTHPRTRRRTSPAAR